MSSTIDPILLQQLLELPEEQRSELAGHLIESLDDACSSLTPQEIKVAWIVELDRRAAEADGGRLAGISYEDAWRQIAGTDE